MTAARADLYWDAEGRSYRIEDGEKHYVGLYPYGGPPADPDVLDDQVVVDDLDDQVVDNKAEMEADADPVQLPPSTFFNDKGTLVTARLGEAIRQAGHLRVGADQRLYRYVRGVYRADGEAWARARVREALGDRVTRHHFAEVVTWLHAFPPTVSVVPPEHLLNVENGLLEWRTGRLYPHDPGVVSTVQLPVTWNPEATCPQVEQFFMDVLPDDAECDFIDEILGYALYAGNPFRKAVLFLGPGGNGKTVVLKLVTGLAGAENVASVPVQVFGENRFAAAELHGRLANICGDLDARAIKRTDVFKMMTGGDPIMAERKNCHPFSFVSFALPMFSANEAPISSDQTQAWFDRWLIVPMHRRFEGNGADPDLAAKITTPAELSGALVLAVNGLRRLMARGGFELPASVKAAGEHYRDRLDTVRGFVTEECSLDPDEWSPRSTLYKAYRTWCADSGRYAVSATTFNEHLRANYPGLEERGRKGIRGWAGIAPTAVTPW